MNCAWSHDGAGAFAKGCEGLNLHGHSPKDVEIAAKAMRMLLCYSNGLPVGAAVFHDGQVHIAVLPTYRGRWLTAGVLREFRAALASCKRALINPANECARRFAVRMGWKVNDVEKGYLVYVPT